MKRKLFLCVSLLMLCVFLTSCGSKDTKQAKIELQTNGGVPYVWEYVIEDDSVLNYVETKSEVETEGLAGGPVTEIFYFKGIKEGTTLVNFNYVSITDKTVDKTESYKVTVDSKLNITVVKVE